MTIRFAASIALLGCAASVCLAQAPKPPHEAPALPPTGSVSGTITCTDTQRPARFADVFLLRKTDGHTAEDSHDLSLVHGRSGIDGAFTLSRIVVGDYYAIPRATGYLLPIVPPERPERPDEMEKNDPDLSHALSNFPIVHVAADRTTHVDLTLQRGAVISGRATYDDGSPVAGMEVDIESTNPKDRSLQNLGDSFRFFINPENGVHTDDDGRYRIAGVAPGKYVLKLKLETDANDRTSAAGEHDFFTHTSQSETTVYSPDTFHEAEARVIDVTHDRGREDADISVKLSGLHTISGRILAGEDHHPINFAMLTLVDDADFYVTNNVQPDGTFRFTFVPEGTYHLMIFGGSDARAIDSIGNVEKLRSYGRLTQSVLVGEHDVVLDDIQLPAATPDKRPATP